VFINKEKRYELYNKIYVFSLLIFLCKGVEMDKISIIVPIYNGEKYLCRCIDSLLTQSYTNVEIILINDGSTDSTFEICVNYEKKDKRIRVLSQKNQGQSVARNYGISVAQGAFYSFVDADDYVNKNYIMRLHELLIQNNADISMCGFTYFFDFEVFESAVQTSEIRKELIENHDILVRMHTEKDEPFVVVWGKLFKKELWNNIRFPAGRICEDYSVLYQLFNNTKRIVKSDEVLYYYFRNNQESSTYILNKKFYEDIQYVLDQEIEYMLNCGHEDIVILVKKRYLYWILDYYGKIRKTNKDEGRKLLGKYRLIYMSISASIDDKMYHFFNFAPNLYCFLKKRK
jgi:glycosyltransferase involved in cell wall biosynthesis